MAIDVIMPQLGESVAEGKILKWLKNVGDPIQADEELLEVSTDKIDMALPSPGAGVLTEILAPVDSVVPVGKVIARIGAAGEVVGNGAAQAAPAPTPAAQAPAPVATASAAPQVAELAATERFSPAVRRLAKEYGIDPKSVSGTGEGGRVTRDDMLRHIQAQGLKPGAGPAISLETTLGPSAKGETPPHLGADITPMSFPVPGAAPVSAPAPPAAAAPPPIAPAPAAAVSSPAPATPRSSVTPIFTGLGLDEMPFTGKRLLIAEHMVHSKRTSAHVHTVFEVDMSKVVQSREKYKKEVEQRYGFPLSFPAYVIRALGWALREYPILNSSIVGDKIVLHKEINIGISVALEDGLIVPVVRNADQKSVLGLAREVYDLANRARNRQLKPDEAVGATFTVTSPGGFGGVISTPIINQPNVAILGIEAIVKRPVVIDDAIAIRPMCYLVLGFDHRVVDGATGDPFLGRVKHYLENADWDQI